MNIRQLHDALRQPGSMRFGCDGPGFVFTKDKAGWLKTNNTTICHIDDLEREDWTCEPVRSKTARAALEGTK